MHDLESRKRAPLYQKKQEEELKAAVDKAVEAETRAHEAELRLKESKVGWAGYVAAGCGRLAVDRLGRVDSGVRGGARQPCARPCFVFCGTGWLLLAAVRSSLCAR